MIRNISFYVLLLVIVLPENAHAQASKYMTSEQKYEFGWWMGAGMYNGDIYIPVNQVFKAIRPAAGLYNRYNFNPRISLKTSVNMSYVAAEDRWSEDPFQQRRNLSFRTRITGAQFQLEFNFYRYMLAHYKYNFTPYLSVGFGVFNYQPQAELDNEWVNLRPLKTELVKYDEFAFNIPVGGGFKCNISKNFTFGVELVYNVTFTDYLDDISGKYPDYNRLQSESGLDAVSLADRSGENGLQEIGISGNQRGDNDRNDVFWYTQISFSYTIVNWKCYWPSSNMIQ